MENTTIEPDEPDDSSDRAAACYGRRAEDGVDYPVQINAQTLYQMHMANSRRLSDLERASKELENTLLKVQLSNQRIEAKLDGTLELRTKVGELSMDLNKAKGAGALAGILLMVANFGISLYAVFHARN